MDTIKHRGDTLLNDAVSFYALGDYRKAAESSAALAAVCAQMAYLERRPGSAPFDPSQTFGFQTVYGFLEQHAPLTVEENGDDAGPYLADDIELAKRCCIHGIAFMSVEPPMALRVLGVRSCHAYPLHVLRKHYHVD